MHLLLVYKDLCGTFGFQPPTRSPALPAEPQELRARNAFQRALTQAFQDGEQLHFTEARCFRRCEPRTGGQRVFFFMGWSRNVKKVQVSCFLFPRLSLPGCRSNSRSVSQGLFKDGHLEIIRVRRPAFGKLETWTGARVCKSECLHPEGAGSDVGVAKPRTKCKIPSRDRE